MLPMMLDTAISYQSDGQMQTLERFRTVKIGFND
jgi:hypothetical protein